MFLALFSACFATGPLLNDKVRVVLWGLAKAQEALLILFLFVDDAADNLHLCQVITVLH